MFGWIQLFSSVLGGESSLNKFWQKPTLAVAVLLLLVAIATLQSVAAPYHAQQQAPSTTTETATVYYNSTTVSTVTIMANSSNIQPLSQYGVIRIQTTAINSGATLNIKLNSTVGPIYLEQLQIELNSQQTHDIVAVGVTIAGLNGQLACSGTIIAAGQLYGDFLPTCTKVGQEITDPAGNLAIAAAAGTSSALSMQPVANEASPITGQVIVIATLCAPITANVTLTATQQ
jgi:hypothetical protein